MHLIMVVLEMPRRVERKTSFLRWVSQTLDYVLAIKVDSAVLSASRNGQSELEQALIDCWLAVRNLMTLHDTLPSVVINRNFIYIHFKHRVPVNTNKFNPSFHTTVPLLKSANCNL